MVCPCVPHDRRQCCIAFLAIVILGIIVGLVLIRGTTVVHGVSVTVDNAYLTTFVLATPRMANSTPPAPTTTAAGAAVTYNLSMIVRVHNLNGYLGVHFAAPLEARFSFDGALFGPRVWLASEGEKLPAGYTMVCRLVMGAVGETVPCLGVDGVAEFARQSSAGVFQVDVVVAGRYTVRSGKRTLAATCALKLPLGASSQKVKCM